MAFACIPPSVCACALSAQAKHLRALAAVRPDPCLRLRLRPTGGRCHRGPPGEGFPGAHSGHAVQVGGAAPVWWRCGTGARGRCRARRPAGRAGAPAAQPASSALLAAHRPSPPSALRHPSPPPPPNTHTLRRVQPPRATLASSHLHLPEPIPVFKTQPLCRREVGTPRTHRRFLNRADGSYGPIPSRRPLGMLSMPFNRTAVRGLYCVGDSTFPGQGVNAGGGGGGCCGAVEAGCTRQLCPQSCRGLVPAAGGVGCSGRARGWGLQQAAGAACGLPSWAR